MGELVKAQGRPMIHDLRAMCDGIGYVTRNGQPLPAPERLPAGRSLAHDPWTAGASSLG
ncbi:MAG: hypothetical protein QOE54_2727 [Streptosporangiaceae bacterium]|nr:hypothetical protein [Streptosporangiaceae bacterium]